MIAIFAVLVAAARLDPWVAMCLVGWIVISIAAGVIWTMLEER